MVSVIIWYKQNHTQTHILLLCRYFVALADLEYFYSKTDDEHKMSSYRVAALLKSINKFANTNVKNVCKFNISGNKP